MFYKQEKLAVLFDGQSFYSAARTLEIETDFRKLRDYFKERGRLAALKYYTMVRDEEESGLIPVLDFISYNGYNVVQKFYKEFENHDGRVVTKGSINIEMAMDMLDLSKSIDHIVLFTGNGDFAPVVEKVQESGCRVTIGSTLNNGMVADELRRVSNDFLELNALRDFISRDVNANVKVNKRSLQNA